jgi:hypothetical protein
MKTSLLALSAPVTGTLDPPVLKQCITDVGPIPSWRLGLEALPYKVTMMFLQSWDSSLLPQYGPPSRSNLRQLLFESSMILTSGNHFLW